MGVITVLRGVTRRARIAGRLAATCAGDSSAGTKILGYYLLCVGLVQLGIVAWGQLHGTSDLGWSRIGLRIPISLVFDDSASRTAYWLGLLWFTGLAVLMLRDRKPLKTYVASEAILLPGSALVLFPRSFLDDRRGGQDCFLRF